MSKLFIVLICIYTTFDITVEAKCSIKISDIGVSAPVILTADSGNNYKLFKPTGEVTSLKPNTKLRLLCTGTNNALASTGLEMMDLKCSKGNLVDNQNSIHRLNQLVCKETPVTTLQKTNEKCGHDYGNTYNIGFDYNGQLYGPLFEICYNSVTDRAIYTHVTLNGAAIDYEIHRTKAYRLSVSGIQCMKKVTTLNLKNQIKRFEKYFGKNQKYIDNTNYLDCARLTAESEFIFGYEREAALTYLNVVPAFNAVIVGNWLKVEEITRATAIACNCDIETFTGHMGNLELPHQNGKEMEIFLDSKNEYSIPRYLFKVLMSKASDSAIVLVTLNNPYIKKIPANNICTDVCAQSGLLNSNLEDIKKGYTICCELDYFKSHVYALPDKVRGKKLLKLSLA